MSLALEGGFLTNHWTTREVPILIFEGFFFLSDSFKGALPLSSVLHYFC